MSRDTTLCWSAGRIRHAAEMVSYAETQLIDIGLNEIALQLLDARLKLEELRLDVIGLAYQRVNPPAPPQHRAGYSAEQLPF